MQKRIMHIYKHTGYKAINGDTCTDATNKNMKTDKKKKKMDTGE